MVEKKNSKYGSFDYPVGILDDVEVHFMHYADFDVAKKKWDERKKRINRSEIRIIDVAREDWQPEHQDTLMQVSMPRVSFYTKETGDPNGITIDFYKKDKEVGEMIADGNIWYYYLDVPLFLNTGEVRRRKWHPFLYKLLRSLP